MSGGTFSISRQIWQHPAFKREAFTEREAWMWMCGCASWKRRMDRVGEIVVSLDRGQLAVPTRFAAKAWGWTDSKVRRFFVRLQKLEMISVKTDAGVTLVTICNYDDYQFGGAPSEAEPTQGRRRADANKKQDEIKTGSVERTNSGASLPPQNRFDEFWAAFPHRNGAKKGRSDSEKKYALAVKSGVSEHSLIAAVVAYRSDADVIKNFGKGPVSWLNQRCWEDEIATPQTNFRAKNGVDNDNPTNKSEQRMGAFMRGA